VDCATNNNPALECSQAYNCRVLYMRFWGYELRFRRLIVLMSDNMLCNVLSSGEEG
jgi:hypothetical protein